MAILYTSLITSNAFLENVVKKNSELAVYRRVHRPPLDLGPAQRRPYPPAADRRASGWRAAGERRGRLAAVDVRLPSTGSRSSPAMRGATGRSGLATRPRQPWRPPPAPGTL